MTMKPKKLLTAAALASVLGAMSPYANAAIDTAYYVIDTPTTNRFDVYNDGKSTFIEAVPGLVIPRATADGQRLILNGVPSQIGAHLNGKAITIIRGVPPKPAPPPTPPKEDPATTLKRIEALTAQLGRMEKLAPAAQETAPTEQVEEDVQVWTVPPKASMRDVVTAFASRAGWIAVIDYKDEQTGDPSDLILDGGLEVKGDFRKAIKQTFNSLPTSTKVMVELRPDNYPPTVFISREGSPR